MRFIQRISLSIRLLTLLLFTSTATATIIRVPQDQPTIQGGIDAAIEGDTVLVDIGRYVENINFNGKNIVVGSLFLTTRDTSYISQTVIDGDTSGSVVKFENHEDSTAILFGLTIYNGMGTVLFDSSGYGGWARFGGGILLEGASPTIAYNKIIFNGTWVLISRPGWRDCS